MALVDADDRHHEAIRRLFEADPAEWIIPWAALPEIDDLLATRVGAKAEDAFFADLADGNFAVEWGRLEDVIRGRPKLLPRDG